MSFELKTGESLRKSVRRIARKQMSEALAHLVGSNREARDVAVHEARKCFKKIRAVLRLVRPEISEKRFHKENVCFRDAGRPLTEVRDAKIFVEALDKLADEYKGHLTVRSFACARRALNKNLRRVRKRILDEGDCFKVVGNAVRQARNRIKKWTGMPMRWPVLDEALERTYRRAKNAFGAALANPTVEKLHEWRKQAKYLRYQLEILTPLWPERMEELAKEADRMGEILGDDHDLAMLRQMLVSDPERFGDQGDCDLLLALIDRKRKQLEVQAQHTGQRFFQDSPRYFARLLSEYGKAWRAEANADPSASTTREQASDF